MKKVIFIIIIVILLVIIIYLIFKSNRIIYKFVNNDNLLLFNEIENVDSTLNTIEFWTYDIEDNGRHPVCIFFTFVESTPYVEKLEFIEIEAVAFKDTKKISPDNTTIIQDIEFYNGKNIVTLENINLKSTIFSQINWSEVNYAYEFLDKIYTKENNVVTISNESRFLFKSLPDTLHVNVKIKWTDRLINKEFVLTKEKYDEPKSKINLKY